MRIKDKNVIFIMITFSVHKKGKWIFGHSKIIVFHKRFTKLKYFKIYYLNMHVYIHTYSKKPHTHEDGLCMGIKSELGACSLKLNVILIHLHGWICP